MTAQPPTCQLCSQPGITLHENLRDRLFDAPGNWTLKRCTGCGFVWLDPMPRPDDLTLAYRNYYTHAADPDSPSLARRWYRQLLNLTPIGRERQRLALMCLDQTPPGKLLDIGCGNGQRLVQFRDRGWDVEGQEIDERAVAVAREHFGLRIHAEPVEKLTGSYHAVILNHVIEHVPDPVGMLAQCHRLLCRDGQLVVITPNVAGYGHRKFGASWRGLEPPRHLHLFTPATLQRAAGLAGFARLVVWTSSARVVGLALGSQSSSRLCALWFQLVAFVRSRLDPAVGEECVLQAKK